VTQVRGSAQDDWWVLYLRFTAHRDFDQAAIQRRLAKGAKCVIQEVGERDLKNLQELLAIYRRKLKHNHQTGSHKKILNLLVDSEKYFSCALFRSANRKNKVLH